jgi:hypothetical protein
MAQLPQQPSALDPPEQSADRGTQPIAQATVSPKNIAVLLGGSMLFLIFVRGVGMVGKSDRSSRADTAGVISAPSTPTLDSARMHGPHMRVNVAVDGTKPNGLPWDGVRDAPDVGLCITAGAQTSCIPTATSERELHQPYCRDSNICRFENVVVPAGARVTIIDVDLIENDVIGTGFCSPNTACRIGAAQVVMTPVQDDLVTASSAPAESAFTTMTPLQHLAAARIAMASNYDPRTRMPNKPMVPTAPTSPNRYSQPSRRRHIGQPLGRRQVSSSQRNTFRGAYALGPGYRDQTPAVSGSPDPLDRTGERLVGCDNDAAS